MLKKLKARGLKENSMLDLAFEIREKYGAKKITFDDKKLQRKLVSNKKGKSLRTEDNAFKKRRKILNTQKKLKNLKGLNLSTRRAGFQNLRNLMRRTLNLQRAKFYQS
jgi:hypothetical protein